MIQTEAITKQRLEDFGEVIREYNELKRQKFLITKKLGLKGVDYSKIKVTNGDSRHSSEQERYIAKLERINNKIKEYEEWINPEKEIIKNQIARVKRWEFRKVLVYRYIEKWKISEIVQDFFEFEDDYEENKNDKYKERILYWLDRGYQELEEISSKPYIPAPQQLTLIGKEEE